MEINLTIYDMSESEISTIVNGHQSAGYHDVQWNGTYYSLVLLLGIILSISGQTITKGPYLADPQPGSITIRWELDQQSKGKVYFCQQQKLKHSAKGRLLGQVSDHYLYEAILNDLIPESEYQS